MVARSDIFQVSVSIAVDAKDDEVIGKQILVASDRAVEESVVARVCTAEQIGQGGVVVHLLSLRTLWHSGMMVGQRAGKQSLVVHDVWTQTLVEFVISHEIVYFRHPSVYGVVYIIVVFVIDGSAPLL